MLRSRYASISLTLALAGCGDDATGTGNPSADSGSDGTASATDGPGGPTTTDTGTTPAVDSSGGTTDPDAGSDDTTGTTGDPPAASRPDLDGDGVADFVLSARGFDGFSGAVWIDYGSDAIPDGPLAADVQLTGGNNLGMAAATCDIDGDGIDELIVASLAGLHVWWGGTVLRDDATDDLLITSSDQLATVGGLNCGDVTGDGVADIVALGVAFGSWSLTVVGGNAMLRDLTTLDVDADPSSVHIDSADGTLLPALGVGDVDGDAVPDVAVGASQADPGGGVYVFAGGSLATGMVTPADLTLVGSAPGVGLGRTLAVDDLDGDGIDDIAASETTAIVVRHGEPGLAAPAANALTGGAGPVAAANDYRLAFEDVDGVFIGGSGVQYPGYNASALDIGIASSSVNQRLLLLRERLDNELVLCTGDLGDDDQAAPLPLPRDRTIPWLWVADGQLGTAVLRHGRTDPFTFMPDGNGKLQTFSWDEAGCQVLERDGMMLSTAVPAPSATVEDVWEEPTAWSVRHDRSFR